MPERFCQEYNLIRQGSQDFLSDGDPKAKQLAWKHAHDEILDLHLNLRIHVSGSDKESQSFLECHKATSEAGLDRFFLLAHLTIGLLLSTEESNWLLAWLSSSSEVVELLGEELPFEQIRSWQWLEVPVLTYVEEKEKGELIRFVVGMGEHEKNAKLHLPDWLPLDDEAGQQLRLAYDAVIKSCSRPCLVLPVFDPEATGKISGISLGVPVAMGFYLLSKQQPWPSGLFATGGIAAGGTGLLEKVGSIGAKKTKASQSKGCNFFLYPYGCQDDAPALLQDRVLECSTLADLFHVLDILTVKDGENAVNNAEKLREYINLLQNPKELLARYHRKATSPGPPPWLLELACKTGRLEFFLPGARENLASLEKEHFCLNFELLLDALESNQSIMGVATLFQDILPCERVAGLYSDINRPQLFHLFFRWASLQLSIANHQGQTAENNPWRNLCYDMLEFDNKQHKIWWISLKSSNQFLIRDFIGNDHNIYRFGTDVPKLLLEGLAVANDRINNNRHDEETLFSYGSGCGTLAMHYAYANQLDKARTQVTCAQDALDGRGEMDYEAQRQQKNLLFIELDAGNPEKALQALCNYVKISTIIESIEKLFVALADSASEIRQRLIFIKEEKEKNWPYIVFSLCRFLADVCQQPDMAAKIGHCWPYLHQLLSETNYYLTSLLEEDQTVSKKPLFPHPYQLSLHNLGRLAACAGKDQEAKLAWNTSLEACLASFPTIRVMALLPASYLWQKKWLSAEKFKDISELLTFLAKSDCPLDKKHFAPLVELNGDTAKALDLVRHDNKRFFPFDFR